MSGTVVHNAFSQTDVRFCVVGWNSVQNDDNAAKIEELRQYAGRAVSSGLTTDEISSDILEASGALFEGVDISLIERPGRRSMVSVVAIAAGGSRCIETGGVEETRLRA